MDTNISNDPNFIELLTSFAGLQRNTSLMPHEICDWLGQAFNNYHKLRYRRELPLLLSLENKGRDFKTIKNNPCYVMTVAWPFLHTQYSAPDVQGLTLLLEGVEIKQLASKPYTDKLKVKVILDLKYWPHVARNMVHYNLYESLVASKLLRKTRDNMKAEAKVLIDYFYPTVSFDLLHFAAEHGIITVDNQSFKDWFEALIEPQKVQLDDIPNNFD